LEWAQNTILRYQLHEIYIRAIGLANAEQLAALRANYLGGNYGYGHAKQALFELICETFKTEREKYNYYLNNLEEVDALLKIGAGKASAVANGVLARVREKLGFEVQ
jgi:tryptophanyl-tRNA synthetase